jgi:hypothetical protein
VFKKIKQLATTFAIGLAMVTPLAVPAVAGAQISTTPDVNNKLCEGASLTVGTCNTTDDPTTKANNLIASVVNIFSLVVGVVAVIMIIVGGFRYITSGGDSNNVTAAKNTILYAIIGLVIVALAQFIVRFVLNRTTGV